MLTPRSASGYGSSAEIVERNLRLSGALGPEQARLGVIGVNVGLHAGTPVRDAWRDYLDCLRAVWHWADYATLNLTSDAAAELRGPRHATALLALLARAQELGASLRGHTGRRVPLLVKLPLHAPGGWMFEVALSAVRLGLDGVIACQPESGTSAVRRTLIRLAVSLPPRAAIVSVGGIDNARAALGRLDAGAHLIQVHRGFQRRGSALVDEIASALRARYAVPASASQPGTAM